MANDRVEVDLMKAEYLVTQGTPMKVVARFRRSHLEQPHEYAKNRLRGILREAEPGAGIQIWLRCPAIEELAQR